MQTKSKTLQQQSIAELALSESFKTMASQNQMESLNVLIEKNPEQILSIPGLTFQHLKEYRAFLAEHNLEHLQKK